MQAFHSYQSQFISAEVSKWQDLNLQSSALLLSLWFSYGILRLVTHKRSEVLEESNTHCYMHVKLNVTLRMEAVFLSITSEHSFYYTKQKPKFISHLGPLIWPTIFKPVWMNLAKMFYWWQNCSSQQHIYWQVNVQCIRSIIWLIVINNLHRNTKTEERI
jgi:hypothetical protein